MRQPISDDVRRFVLASVPSVPYLEALLLLRAGAHSDWNPGDIARRLYVTPASGEELLALLAESGLAVRAEGGRSWRWNAAADMAPIVDELARIYAENVVGVTELIHSRQERRAQQFADAFRLRKKEE